MIHLRVAEDLKFSMNSESCACPSSPSFFICHDTRNRNRFRSSLLVTAVHKSRSISTSSPCTAHATTKAPSWSHPTTTPNWRVLFCQTAYFRLWESIEFPGLGCWLWFMMWWHTHPRGAFAIGFNSNSIIIHSLDIGNCNIQDQLPLQPITNEQKCTSVLSSLSCPFR